MFRIRTRQAAPLSRLKSDPRSITASCRLPRLIQLVPQRGISTSSRDKYMMDREVQRNLIMEILQAQPSLRDSKTYLNSFAPRQGNAFKPQPPPSFKPAKGPSPSPDPHPEFPLPPNVATPGTLHSPSTTTWNDHAPAAASLKKDDAPAPLGQEKARLPLGTPQAILDKLSKQHKDLAANSLQNQTEPSTNTSTVLSTETLADSHTALVKVQGPFTDRQLASIAEGLVYLKKLGLVSVVVVDCEDWSEFSANFDKEGKCTTLEENGDEIDDDLGWLHFQSSGVKGKERSTDDAALLHDKRVHALGKKQERLRKKVVSEAIRLSDFLNDYGALARPFPQAVLRVDRGGALVAEETFKSQDGDEHILASSSSQSTFRKAISNSRSRAPLLSDDGLSCIRSALASGQIPVIPPFALYESETDGSLVTLCVKANDVMVALARDMVNAARSADDLAKLRQEPVGEEVDMMPLRLMVINREGGIPSHARGGNPHLSINLASEYHHIKNSFIWQESHPTALSNLDMVTDCLSYMPQSSSGVVVTHRSPRSLIANLITNKAAHSPSLPHRLLANKKDVIHTPTIIRPGLPIRVIEDFSQVNLAKLRRLLEESFRRVLDEEAYYSRLEKQMDFVIVTGDYQGAAIVTKEWAPDDDRDKVEPIAYLDKFAVLPSLQGSGTVDFLWGALRDEVQGLGLLDALNDNGGKGGYGKGRDLVWKSRADNPVNRWYYERSNGFARIDTERIKRRHPELFGGGLALKQRGEGEKGDEDEFKPLWSLFWCDAEDKLARLSGERRLAAGARHEEACY
ncbi:hypothetical protein IE53DRAFT_232834 [Violaceomyces palustris]|uniref:Uncharacterized protein n=1 Tax=Violaceomyces palustris TaxID=1673888 RepID=A0ACD0P4C3_9BASI|nr:hypothetical protein IE53DRAFT_232834 [Violaceomyces palustris]